MTARTGAARLAFLDGKEGRELLAGLYGEDEADAQRLRFKRLAAGLLERNGGANERPLRWWTAAGRTELGGNHTDHNRGKVLAASVQFDALAAVLGREDNKIIFRSTGFPDVQIDISDLSARADERGTSEALLRGVAAGMKERGIGISGWEAEADSTVLPGSGLSSSAALEVLAAAIFDGLYGGGNLSAMELAKIAQKAENIYYGKPSGLMDQAASAHGGAVFIDFSDPENPAARRLPFDPGRAGYVLCVVNTGGSHAALTPHYAAVPAEMRAVAEYFGEKFLGDLSESVFYTALASEKRARELREACGDRAILRAIHFFNENRRVDSMVSAIDAMNAASGPKAVSLEFERFLDAVNASGASSWELLQNCYPEDTPREEGLPLALALSRNFAANAGVKIACRVHGGGFAGTIQAYIPAARFPAYRASLEAVFGKGSVSALKIRPIGAAEIALLPIPN
ncbi:MAG: galactokinase [Spirochaetaceae bacterium]|jgi:galactokinase|nr:galactokinase [Spirochaetaceae bacterium]